MGRCACAMTIRCQQYAQPSPGYASSYAQAHGASVRPRATNLSLADDVWPTRRCNSDGSRSRTTPFGCDVIMDMCSRQVCVQWGDARCEDDQMSTVRSAFSRASISRTEACGASTRLRAPNLSPEEDLWPARRCNSDGSRSRWERGSQRDQRACPRCNSKTGYVAAAIGDIEKLSILIYRYATRRRTRSVRRASDLS